MFSVTPYCLICLLKELLGLPQAIDKLDRLDLPAVGIPSDRQTRYVDRQSCQTPILLLFDGQLLMVLSLLSIDGGEDMKF